MRGSAWCQEGSTAGAEVGALPGAWHRTGWLPWWVLQCMAWYGVGALVKPTAAAIRRLCLRPVTWWEPAGSAGGPSRGCQAVPTHTLARGGRVGPHGGPVYGPVATLLVLPAGGRAVFCMSLCSMQAFDYLQLIIFTNHCSPIWKTEPVRKIEGGALMEVFASASHATASDIHSESDLLIKA